MPTAICPRRCAETSSLSRHARVGLCPMRRGTSERLWRVVVFASVFRFGLRSWAFAALVLALVVASALVCLPSGRAAGGTPSCVIRGPQWTQHIPALGVGHPAMVRKGRLYVVMPPRYGCARARKTLARIFPLMPPHARAHDRLRGAPAGWECFSSGSNTPADMTFAGLCQGPKGAFLEWGPTDHPLDSRPRPLRIRLKVSALA